MNEKKFNWANSLKLEKEYWIRHKKRICSKEWLEHVKKRTQWFLEWYKDYGYINGDSKILQVGSGAEGEINFLEKGYRFAIDPLADFYKLYFGNIIDTRVKLLRGRGENLPFESNSFDLVITFNSLDHSENPPKVLSEISRVLKKGGILYIGVHIRSEFGYFMFECSKRYRQLTNHYYSYTKRFLKKEVRKYFFLILDEKGESGSERMAISRADTKDNNFKYLLKFLISKRECMYHILAKKV